MSDRVSDKPTEDLSDPYGWSYEAHAERQARLGLQLTPAERLRWLEETNAMMRELLGRARRTAPNSPPGRPGEPRDRAE